MKRFSLARASLMTLAGVVFLHWVTSCHTNAPAQSPTATSGPSSMSESAGGSTAGPCESAAEPAECYMTRAWLIEELLGDLYELELAGDKRGVPATLEALETGEPVVQVEAMRVLGPWADEPGVGAAVLPWLLKDDFSRETAAARVLQRSHNPGLARLGEQFRKGHEGDNAPPPLAGWWRDPKLHGIDAYPGATRFPPGDSVRSIGLLTSDSVDQVIAHYRGSSALQPLDAASYRKKLAEAEKRRDEGYQSPAATRHERELQDLAQQFQQTHDPKLLQRMQQIGSELQKQPSLQAPGGAITVPLPDDGPDSPFSHVRWLSLEERDGMPLRAVFAYVEPAVGKTVVILSWDPIVHRETDPRTALVNEGPS